MTKKHLALAKQNKPKQQKPINITLILICWAVPMAWVGAIPSNKIVNESSSLIEKSVLAGEKLIKQFSKKYGTAPQNLNELRAFGISKNSTFQPWDAYNQRLDYLRLSKSSWYLRSFGKDSRQNTLMTAQDPVASSIQRDPGNGVSQVYSKQSTRFNPAVLLGTVSSQGNWHARLYVDKVSGSSRLLVRHRVRKSYFMITEHNTVEEFYWLPDGYRIVFSATGSNRYKDGIYLWNLLSDQTTNIFPGHRNIGATDNSLKAKFWLFSLAGVKENPTSLFAFTKPKTNEPLNMLDFFTAENLVSITIPEDGKVTLKRNSKILFHQPMTSAWLPSSGLLNCSRAEPNQKEWCQLPLSGAFQDVLNSWQSYAEKQAGGPMFSYSLLQLTALYSDSYRLLLQRLIKTPDNTELLRNAEILRSYGAEIAQALVNLPIAPSWIRATAWFNFNQLNSQKPLPFQLSKVIILDSE